MAEENGNIDFTVSGSGQPSEIENNETIPAASEEITEPETYPDNLFYAEDSDEAEVTELPVDKSQQFAYYHPILPEKPKKSMKKLKMAMASVCAVILCFGAGIGGSYTYQKFLSGNGSTTTGGTKVIYQSVTRTDQNGDKADNLSVADVVSLAANSVVEITTETVTTGSRLGQYVGEGAGSGVIVTADGYIATNNHVIDGASKITVRLKNSKEYSALLVGTDTTTDLAVIKINATGLQPAVFGKSADLQVGETAVAIGNPLGELGGTVTSGIISALDREITIDGQAMTLLQTNAEINPGNSGGGLFNSKGELIGVVNAKSSGTDLEGLGFAIPIDTASPVIKEIMEHGYVTGRIDLGLELVDVSDATSAMMYRVNRTGVYISKVTNSSLKFQSGDLIVSIDDTKISSSSDVTTLLSKHKVGDTLSVVVIRNNKQISVSLKLAEYVPSSSSNSGSTDNNIY